MLSVSVSSYFVIALSVLVVPSHSFSSSLYTMCSSLVTLSLSSLLLSSRRVEHFPRLFVLTVVFCFSFFLARHYRVSLVSSPRLVSTHPTSAFLFCCPLFSPNRSSESGELKMARLDRDFHNKQENVSGIGKSGAFLTTGFFCCYLLVDHWLISLKRAKISHEAATREIEREVKAQEAAWAVCTTESAAESATADLMVCRLFFCPSFLRQLEIRQDQQILQGEQRQRMPTMMKMLRHHQEIVRLEQPLL